MTSVVTLAALRSCQWMEACRCCLGPAGAGARLLGERLQHRLRLCTGLQVEAAAGLPDHICRKCAKRLRDSFQFRHQCHESDANLRVQHQINSNTDVKREIIFNSVDVSQCDWNAISNDDDDSDSDLPLNNLKALKEDNLGLEAKTKLKDKPAKVKKKRCINALEKSAKKSKNKQNKLSKNIFKPEITPEFAIADINKSENNLNQLYLQINNEVDSIDDKYQNQNIIPIKLEEIPLNQLNDINNCSNETNKVKMKIDFGNSQEPENIPEQTDTKKLYYCDICGHSVKIKYDLITHFRRHTGEKPYKCDTCDKQFAHDAGLRAHKKQHTGQKSFVCDMCGKGLSTKETLLAHRRLHTGELPYTCPTCGRAFRALTNLRSHRKIHTGDKRHPCPVCNKLFYTKSDMRNHARRHTGERPYACSLCPQRFTGKSNHRLHMKIHAGQKDFQCPFCPKTFVSRDSMRRHGRIHTGERTFECQECRRKFAHRSTLISHQAIHSKTKDYICDICCQRFGYPSGLYVHRKKKHNIQSSRIIMPIT